MSGRALTQAEQSLTGGYYDFHHHFVAAVRFVALDWKFGSSGPDAKERRCPCKSVCLICSRAWARW